MVNVLGLGSKQKTCQKKEATLKSNKWLIIPIAIVSLSAGIANAIVVLFATDIAITYFGSPTNVAVGAVSQLSTVNMAGEILATILLTVFVLKFRHKFLYISGAVLIVLSAIGSYFASTLIALQFFYALEGIGSLIISVLSAVLIADVMPQEKRGKALSYLFSTSAAAMLIIIPTVGLLSESGGWRLGLISVVLPVSLIGLVLSMFMLPSKNNEVEVKHTTYHFIESFKNIFRNKSALACLIANLFTVAGTEVGIYAIAFYRVQFSAPTELTVVIFEFSFVLFFLGILFSGRLIDRYGAKPIALISTFFAACFTGIFFFVQMFWLAVALDMLHVWFTAMATPAFACLILEQIPKHRSTMFSLNSLFNNIGKLIAPIIGGLLLAFSSQAYSEVGFVLAGMTIIGCVVIVFFVKDGHKDAIDETVTPVQNLPAK